MLIYLPYDDPEAIAAVLDDERLMRHLNSVFVALNHLDGRHEYILPDESAHRGITMWQGHMEALAQMGWSAMIEARSRRLMPGSDMGHYRIAFEELSPGYNDHEAEWPNWWGSISIHVAHRALLIHLDPSYAEKFPNVTAGVEQEEVWPVWR